MADQPHQQKAAIAEALLLLETFQGPDLTRTISGIEELLESVPVEDCAHLLSARGVKAEVLQAAGVIKRLAGQINVVVHALGILLCLPHILRPGEVIEYVSLGAGNTGRAFDLETNLRVAEFKFIHWKGGAESIRQNVLFKDFFELAEHRTTKQKFLYVLGPYHVERFLNGRRAISSVLSRNEGLRKKFAEKHGTSYKVVRDYFEVRKATVAIEDVSAFVPGLISVAIEADEPDGG